MPEPPEFTQIVSEPWSYEEPVITTRYAMESWPYYYIPDYMYPVPIGMMMLSSGRDWWRMGGVGHSIRRVIDVILRELWGAREPPTFAQLVSEAWPYYEPPSMVKLVDEHWSS